MEISTGEYIEHQAIERKRQDEWQERQRIAGEERQQRERDRAEMERLRQKELDEFRNLAGSADRWFRSRIIRDYINEVMRKTMSHGTLSEELIDWVVWAKKKCNWYDPLLNAADELMEGVDRTTLTISSRSKTISGD